MFMEQGEKEKILNRVAACLARQHPEVLFAYAHGSFVNDGPFRDLDVAIFLLPEIAARSDFHYEMQMEAQIEKALGAQFAIDVRALNTAKLSFQYHVLRGRLLIDRNPDVRIDFSAKTASRYLDIAPILNHHTREAFQIARS